MKKTQNFCSNSLVASVVLINYNQGHYLEEALNSVLNQTYKNLEIFVIDGGSTDMSKTILESYPSVNWISERDNSSGHAVAKGVALATGDIIYFMMSSDGFYDIDWIKTSMDHFDKDTNLGLVSADVIGVNQSGIYNGYKWPKGKTVKWGNKEIFFNWLFHGIGVTPITFGIRKDILNICAPSIENMVDPRHPNSVDYFWYLIGNFFNSGYTSIKIAMISSFVRFHADRVDDADYLPRQRYLHNSLIISRRRQLLLSRHSACFISPSGEIIESEKISYLEILSKYIFSKIRNLFSRFKRDPFDIRE